MLRLTLGRRAVTVPSQAGPLVPTLSSTVTAPALFFADRAVKSTHACPTFLCTRYALVSGCERGSAAVALRQIHAPGLSTSPQPARLGSPTRLVADIRVRGCGVVAALRGGELRFLCQGDRETQYHSLTLYDQDVFVLLSGLSSIARLEATVNALQSALRLYSTDVEYAAEEALLSLPGCPGVDGSVCVVGKAATNPCCDVLPPLSSATCDEV